MASAFLGAVSTGAMLLGGTAGIVPPSEPGGTAARYWHLEEVGAMYVPQTFQGSWSLTSSAVNMRLTPLVTASPGVGYIDGQSTALATTAVAAAASSSYKVCLYRGVSCPLAAQTISGTVSPSIYVKESNADGELFWYVYGYVTAGDTDTPRGVLLDNYAESSTNEWTTTLAATSFQSPQALNPVDVEQGDRMVWELGFITRSTNVRTGTIEYGTDGSAVADSSLYFSNYIKPQGLLVRAQDVLRDSSNGGLQYIETGFYPKAALAIVTGGAMGAGLDLIWSIGMTDFVRQACRMEDSADGSNPSNAAYGDHQNLFIWIYDNNVAAQSFAKAIIHSRDDTGFTINWIQHDSATQEELMIVAYGGDDLEAKLGSMPAPSATGTPQTTHVDTVGFAPDVCFFLSSHLTALSTSNQNTVGSGGEVPGFGVATFTPVANAYTGGGELTGVTPSQVWRRQSQTYSIYVPDISNSATLGNPLLEGAVTGQRPGGFTVSWTTVSASALNTLVPYLALRGVRAQLLSITVPSNTEAAIQTTATTFVPRCAVLETHGGSALDTTDTTTRMVLSIYAGGNAPGYYGSSVAMSDNVATTQVHRFYTGTYFQVIFPAATDPTVENWALTRAFNTSGMTLNWAATDAFNRNLIALVLGDGVDEGVELSDPSGDGVPTAGSDPSAGASLTAQGVVPLVLAEVQTDSGAKAYGKATKAAPAAYTPAGWIEGRITRVGPITRSLSDWRGVFQTGSCQLELSDYDRTLRGLANSGVLLNKRVDLYLATNAQIDASTAARRVFQGIIRSYVPGPGLTFTLNLEDFHGSRLSQFFKERTVPATVLDTTTFPNLPTELVGKPEPVCYGLLSDESSGTSAVGVVPCLFVGRRFLSTGSGGAYWDEFLVCRGAVKQIQSWFGPTLSDPVRRVKMPTGTEGVDFLIPGYAGWTAWLGSSTPYRTLNSKRYTVIYARGPRSLAGQDKTVPLAVNLAGYEHTGDATGTMISGIARQVQHFLVNFVYQTATGNWLSPPTVAGYSQVNTTSFTTVNDAHSTRLAGGYKGAWMLGHDQTTQSLSEMLRLACQNGDFGLYINRQGQLSAAVEDSSSASVGTFRNVTDIQAGSLSIQHAVDAELFNKINYRYGYRYVPPITQFAPAQGKHLPSSLTETAVNWYSGDLSSSDSTSITNNQETRELDLDFKFMRDSTVVADVVDHILQRHKNGPKYAQFTTVDLGGTAVEIGDNLNLVHDQGLSATGYAGTETFRCLAHVLDVDGMTVTLQVQDITGL